MQVVTGNHYLAFVLDEETRQRVLSKYPKRHDVHVCHHVTIAYSFGHNEVAGLQYFIDSKPTFELDRFIGTETIDLFAVNVNGFPMHTDQSKTHLTFTRSALSRNADSSKVINGHLVIQETKPAEGPLTGHFELIPYGSDPYGPRLFLKDSSPCEILYNPGQN